jgi:hypothetical protein
MLSSILVLFALWFGQPAPGPAAWAIDVDPATAQTGGVHWTLSLSARYCGGYALGDGVFIQPETPLTLPDPVPADAVLFAGGAADASVQNGVLRVVPSDDRLWSQVCIDGDRPFTVELLPSLGLTNPDPGTYTVDTWIGAGPPAQLSVSITR